MKVKEAREGSGAPLVVASGDEGGYDKSHAPSMISKRGVGKQSKSCVAPSRLSLRIKNLSYK